MAEILSLSKARKAKAAAEREAKAAENRARFGRTKAERDRLRREEEAATTRLDAHRRDRPETPDDE